MTVRVISGDAARWTHLGRVWMSQEPVATGAQALEVEASRAYGDRLVLKLKGIDDANAAAGYRGSWVLAPAEEVPPLPEGEYWVSRLLGLEVIEEGAGTLGRVTDVIAEASGGILVVARRGGGEVMIPLAREFVLEVSEAEGRVRVRLPEGLLEINER